MREKEIQKGDDLATAVIIAQRAEQEERVQRMELERVAAGLEALYDLNADWLALHAHPNNAHRKETVALGARRSSTLASVPRPSDAQTLHLTPRPRLLSQHTWLKADASVIKGDVVPVSSAYKKPRSLFSPLSSRSR
jgi:hypothetical protein